jgi:hypothetical protein
VVAKITGLACSTINRGEDDLDAEPLAKGRVRRAGGGRRALSTNSSQISIMIATIEALSAGDDGLS